MAGLLCIKRRYLIIPYIYQITNDINQKKYIGKTTKTINERWREHCKDANKDAYSNRPLYRAIRKYGIEHFHIEELEECSLDVLSEREKYWIETTGSFKNGYNATLGGDGKPYIDRELVLRLYNQYQSCIEVARLIGINKDTVSKILKENKITPRTSGEVNSHGVIMLDKENSAPIKAFTSIANAARWLIDNNKSLCKENGLKSHIADVCNGKRRSVANYKWAKVI